MADNKIPKIIHYCWFGLNPIPELEQKCIDSWSKFFPDYEIKFWNENNFDVNKVPFVRQAYENKKFAFVSDYVRMYALYEFGGIYFDTDLEIIKNIDYMLVDEAFLGFENRTMIAAGAIGAVPKHQLFGKMLDYYNNNSFQDENGNIDTTTIVKLLSNFLNEMGFEQDNREQLIDGVHIYERDIFYPKKHKNNVFDVTERSVSIHYGSASWLTAREKRRGESLVWRNFFRPLFKKLRKVLIQILGEKRTKKIERNFRNKIS